MGGGGGRGGLAQKTPASPVTFHFIAEFLDVAKLAAGVALLLVRMFAVAGHVASFPTVVTQVLPLPFGLLAVPGNVATLVAVVACCGGTRTIQKIYTGKSKRPYK